MDRLTRPFTLASTGLTNSCFPVLAATVRNTIERGVLLSTSRTLTPTPARARLDAFIARHSSNGRTLDLGCGASPYADLFPNRVGADFVVRRGVAVRMDAQFLPFRSGQFDVVLCTEMLEHVREPAEVISEIGRVLRPGGTCILTTRFCYPIHDAPHDYYRFTQYSLRYLFRNWHVSELSADTTSSETIHTLQRYVAYQNKGLSAAPAKLIWRVASTLRKTLMAVTAPAPISLDDMRVTAGFHVVATKPSADAGAVSVMS